MILNYDVQELQRLKILLKNNSASLRLKTLLEIILVKYHQSDIYNDYDYREFVDYETIFEFCRIALLQRVFDVGQNKLIELDSDFEGLFSEDCIEKVGSEYLLSKLHSGTAEDKWTYKKREESFYLLTNNMVTLKGIKLKRIFDQLFNKEYKENEKLINLWKASDYQMYTKKKSSALNYLNLKNNISSMMTLHSNKMVSQLSKYFLDNQFKYTMLNVVSTFAPYSKDVLVKDLTYWAFDLEDPLLVKSFLFSAFYKEGNREGVTKLEYLIKHIRNYIMPSVVENLFYLVSIAIAPSDFKEFITSLFSEQIYAEVNNENRVTDLSLQDYVKFLRKPETTIFQIERFQNERSLFTRKLMKPTLENLSEIKNPKIVNSSFDDYEYVNELCIKDVLRFHNLKDDELVSIIQKENTSEKTVHNLVGLDTIEIDSKRWKTRKESADEFYDNYFNVITNGFEGYSIRYADPEEHLKKYYKDKLIEFLIEKNNVIKFGLDLYLRRNEKNDYIIFDVMIDVFNFYFINDMLRSKGTKGTKGTKGVKKVEAVKGEKKSAPLNLKILIT